MGRCFAEMIYIYCSEAWWMCCMDYSIAARGKTGHKGSTYGEKVVAAVVVDGGAAVYVADVLVAADSM